MCLDRIEKYGWDSNQGQQHGSLQPSLIPLECSEGTHNYEPNDMHHVRPDKASTCFAKLRNERVYADGPNVKLTGAARFLRAASSDQRERG